MNEPIAIVLTACKRPKYLRRVLAELAQCRGIEDCVFLPHIEPGNDEIRSLIETFHACDMRPTFNQTILGPMSNIRASWLDGFAVADYVVIVEEDIVPAKDFIEFHRWANDRFKGSEKVLNVTAYNRRSEPCPSFQDHEVNQRSGFHGWGSGSWKTKLEFWTRIIHPKISWDTMIDQTSRMLNMIEIYPELSRCQNIGITSSVQTVPIHTPEWFMENHRLKHWAGDLDLRSGNWTVGW